MYFSWGNIEGHTGDSGYNFSTDVYNATPGAAIQANLSLAQDAARVELGAPWRMPTSAEYQELEANCTSEWITLKGVFGRLFSSKVNGNTVFFPAAGLCVDTSLVDRGSRGLYWSSTYNSDTFASICVFDSASVTPLYNGSRRDGITVRAVMEPNP